MSPMRYRDMVTFTTKETLAITANWTGWIRFCIDSALLTGNYIVG